MSFVGGIFDFSFLFSVFYLVGGSPRPVSYTEFFFYVSILISHFCGMSFLGGIFDFSFLFSIFYLVGGSRRPVSYTEKFFTFQFQFLNFVGCPSWEGFLTLVFYFLFSIWLGAPVGLCFRRKNLF